MFSTGATGLEPATSGVTDHFQVRDMSDDGLRIAHFMRFLGLGSRRPRMVEPSDFGAFAARLLPKETMPLWRVVHAETPAQRPPHASRWTRSAEPPAHDEARG
jgi:hypothetical protein